MKRNRRMWWGVLTVVGLMMAGVVLALALAHTEESRPPQASPSPQSTETPPAQPGYSVKVYFSRHQDSDNDPSLVFPVVRIAANSDLTQPVFALKEFIQGPTRSEQAAGYFSTLDLSGINNCGGNDFTVKMANGRATLQFCRTVDLRGVMADAQLQADLMATLKQFSGVDKVVILNYKGDCLFNDSGLNLCLKP